MSGHSKWSTIKHKKGKADAARGRLFTRLIKEITIAARMGGGAEDSNPRLRTAVLSAKANNMPMDNIARAIKKGTGELEGVSYEEVTYEGYGPEGVALLVECVTDSRNRCVSEVRHCFTRFGGKLAEPGAVSWQFGDRHRILVASEGKSEDEVMLAAMEAGAEDLNTADEGFEVLCSPDLAGPVQKALTDAGLQVKESGRVMVPSTTVKVEGKPAQTLMKLMDQLEELDDVQNLWANFEMDDELMDEME